MSTYRVTWEIDIETDGDAKMAAMRAKWFQIHGDWSSVFQVFSIDGEHEEVDVDDMCSDAEWDAIRNGVEPPE